MILDGEVRPFRLPLRVPLETGASKIQAREGALLVLRDSEGRRGFGEAAPIPGFRAFVVESAGVSRRVLTNVIPLLRGRSPEDVASLLEEIGIHHPASRFALETALVDLAAQARGVRVADWLAGGSAPRELVPVNALVAGAHAEEVRATAGKALAQGFRTFKLKVGVETLADDAKRVAALRQEVGERAEIRLDANGAWSPGEAANAIDELSRFEVEYVEDPIRLRTKDDVAKLAELRDGASALLGVDDAAADPALLEEIFASDAADVLVLKAACLGGLAATRAVALDARNHGMHAVLTSSIDSAVGMGATLQLAASIAGELPACGLATSDLLASDVGTPPGIEAGAMRLPSEPGLGVMLARDFA